MYGEWTGSFVCDWHGRSFEWVRFWICCLAAVRRMSLEISSTGSHLLDCRPPDLLAKEDRVHVCILPSQFLKLSVGSGIGSRSSNQNCPFPKSHRPTRRVSDGYDPRVKKIENHDSSRSWSYRCSVDRGQNTSRVFCGRTGGSDWPRAIISRPSTLKDVWAARGMCLAACNNQPPVRMETCQQISLILSHTLFTHAGFMHCDCLGG